MSTLMSQPFNKLFTYVIQCINYLHITVTSIILPLTHFTSEKISEIKPYCIHYVAFTLTLHNYCDMSTLMLRTYFNDR